MGIIFIENSDPTNGSVYTVNLSPCPNPIVKKMSKTIMSFDLIDQTLVEISSKGFLVISGTSASSSG